MMLNIRKYPSYKPSIILQSSDEVWQWDGEVQLDHNLKIYTESVVLPPKLEAIGGEVGIYTNVLFTSGEAKIDVSGADADDTPSKSLSNSPQNGANGSNGGSLQLYVESTDLEVIQKLSLDAGGGRGANGQGSSQAEIGGKGGDGGNPGYVTVVLNNGRFSKELYDKADWLLSTDPDTEDDQRHALISFIEYFESFTSHASSMPSVATAIKELKSNIAPGADIKGLLDVLRKRVIRELNNASDRLVASIPPITDTRPGAAGSGGTGTAKTNEKGREGENILGNPKIIVFGPDAQEMQQLPIPIAHPDQCAMVLASIKLDYYVGSKNRIQACGDKLVRLRDRLLFLNGLEPSHPIYQAYKEAEPTMYLAPRADLDSTDLRSIAGLREVSDSVGFLLRQLTSGLDFFGHKPDWVPRGSHTFYDNMTATLLQHVEKSEYAYKSYTTSATNKEGKIAALRDMRDEVQSSIDAARDFIQRLQPSLETTVNAILALDGDMKDRRQYLKDEMSREIAAIRSLEPALGADLDDVFAACTMVAFCPNPAMVGVQVVGLTYKAFERDVIEDDTGTRVQKEFLVQKVTNIQSTPESLVEGYKVSRGERSNAILDDPGADKLIAVKEDFMKLISRFKKALNDTGVHKVAKAFDDFINVTLERNDKVMLYNASINLFYKKLEDIKSGTRKLQGLSSDILKTIDPDLPGVSVFMERAYSDSIWVLLESLYMTQRALGFWTLSNRDHIAEALKYKPSGFIDAATLAYVRTRLLRAYREAVELKGRNPQTFQGIKYYMPPRELGQWTRSKNMKGMVIIPPAFQETSLSENPFASKHNVRLHTVRFFAEGVNSDSDTLIVSLTHLGSETIVDSTNNPHSYTHERVKLQFQYRLADLSCGGPGTVDGIIGDATRGDVTRGDVYALVGPFAAWIVEIDGRYNPGVDIRGVKKAWFEFSGEFYTF